MMVIYFTNHNPHPEEARSAVSKGEDYFPTGNPAEGADTLETVEVLESAFRDLAGQGAEEHPGLLHL